MPDDVQRVIGKVAGVNRDRGFFFIEGPDGRDYFALASQLPDHISLNRLTQKTHIEFTPVNRGKGPAADNLLIVNESDLHPSEDPTAKRLGFGKEQK